MAYFLKAGSNMETETLILDDARTRDQRQVPLVLEGFPNGRIAEHYGVLAAALRKVNHALDRTAAKR